MSNDDVIFSAMDSDTKNRKVVVNSYQDLIQEFEKRGDLPWKEDWAGSRVEEVKA